MNTSAKVLEKRAGVAPIALARHPRVEVASVATVLAKRPEPVHCVAAASPLRDAVSLIAGGKALVVVAAGKVCGTLAADDLARAWIKFGASPQATVGAAMSACAHTVTPAHSVEDCLRILGENGLRFLPVVGSDSGDIGEPIGLLSLERLLEEKIEYLARVCKESELDQRVIFLRGTYSC
jgi:CBS domain-containing protein